MQKKICLIATGGTIASVDLGTGLTPAIKAEELLEYVPELKSIAHIDVVQLMQLDSSNLIPSAWQLMAESIIARLDEYDGFVLSHGTDTMAYTAAALYYMLRNLHKPVVLTGSQLPVNAPNTDARRNLLTAFYAAAAGRAGVYIAFDGHIIFGNVAKKLYTESFHAFYSINRPEAGQVDLGTGNVSWQMKAEEQSSFTPRLKLDERVAVLKLLPGTQPALLRLMVDAGYRGIILEAFGAGGVPDENSAVNLLPAIQYAAANGVIIVCTTQCLYDGVHLDTYEVGQRALHSGVISGEDATLEALTVRLMLALGENTDINKARESFCQQ